MVIAMPAAKRDLMLYPMLAAMKDRIRPRDKNLILQLGNSVNTRTIAIKNKKNKYEKATRKLAAVMMVI